MKSKSILEYLKIEIISANDFMDKYDGEDGEEWDGVKGRKIE